MLLDEKLRNQYAIKIHPKGEHEYLYQISWQSILSCWDFQTTNVNLLLALKEQSDQIGGQTDWETKTAVRGAIYGLK